MKQLALLLTGLVGFMLDVAFAGDTPRCSLLELHSCEVLAGGCVVSSEAPQSSRYMLRAWDFAVGRSSHVHEPLLKLTWDDHGKRNVFLARFGEPDSVKNRYVTLGEVCGTAKTLF